jgi:uncharacterized damage-inducible protein DinB
MLMPLFAYGDWANDRLLHVAAGLSDEQLDRDLSIGPGTLRRILIHTHHGESVWLQRWKQTHDGRWPSEKEPIAPRELADRLARLRPERDAFLAGLSPERLAGVQVYRDSRGNDFKAPLRDMILQGLVHSVHHRAQAVNAIKRLGGETIELDYMNHVRVPV